MNWLERCDLPVKAVLQSLADALQTRRMAVLSAAPGAGKTTLVPPYLLEKLYPDKGRILMLEPRRIAARAAANRIAELLGERAGQKAGYRVRGDKCVSKDTRIEIITEGMLTRLIQQNPELSGVSLLIFDEFHERNIHSDLGLALALDIAGALRDDLHILVMSATLETERIAAIMGDAPVIETPGRMFPVTEHFGADFGDTRNLPERMANALRRIAQKEKGSILAFLPGAGEIIRTAELLRDMNTTECRIMQLYGALDKKAQDEAVAPAPAGTRKIVLATNIAESSITIEGVRVVADSGLERVMRFNPATAMPGLETVKISLASAIQRAGRAGRLEPGAVYRLWSEADHSRLVPNAVPEILETELSGLSLELAQWGANAEDLKWLDVPPAPKLTMAKELLTRLGALDSKGKITDEGRKLAGLAVHPRLGAMLLKSGKYAPLACELAALLEERDFCRDNADIERRLELWRSHPEAFRTLNVVRDQLLHIMHIHYTPQSAEMAGVLLAYAYPEWIARSRGVPGINYLLAGGKGARLNESDDLRRHEFLAAARLDWSGNTANIRLAAPLTKEDIFKYFAGDMAKIAEIRFDKERERVAGALETRLGALVLKKEPLTNLPPDKVIPVLAEAVRNAGLHLLNLSPSAKNLLDRVRFAARYTPENYPDWSDDGLLENMEEILSAVPEVRSFEDLRRTDWHNVFAGLLGYNIMSQLDREYPERLTVPTGSKIKIDYSAETPVLAVRVQELYGMKTHPAVGIKRIPVKLALLSPAHRTIQITADLPVFWQSSWSLVRKDMRARYPKHIWPENPAEAAPTARAKPKGT